MQRFEVGYDVYVQSFRSKKGITDDGKVDITKDKNFLFAPPELRVKWTKVDLNGKVQQTLEDDVCPYQTMLLSNIPQQGDECVPPDPTQPWLEMHAATPKGFKPKEGSKKSILFSDSRQHVSSLELACGGDTPPFMIAVDGQLFGPFAKIRVTPLEKEGKRVVFPIQVFFPPESC